MPHRLTLPRVNQERPKPASELPRTEPPADVEPTAEPETERRPRQSHPLFRGVGRSD